MSNVPQPQCIVSCRPTSASLCHAAPTLRCLGTYSRAQVWRIFHLQRACDSITCTLWAVVACCMFAHVIYLLAHCKMCVRVCMRCVSLNGKRFSHLRRICLANFCNNIYFVVVVACICVAVEFYEP